MSRSRRGLTCLLVAGLLSACGVFAALQPTDDVGRLDGSVPRGSLDRSRPEPRPWLAVVPSVRHKHAAPNREPSPLVPLAATCAIALVAIGAVLPRLFRAAAYHRVDLPIRRRGPPPLLLTAV